MICSGPLYIKFGYISDFPANHANRSTLQEIGEAGFPANHANRSTLQEIGDVDFPANHAYWSTLQETLF